MANKADAKASTCASAGSSGGQDSGSGKPSTDDGDGAASAAGNVPSKKRKLGNQKPEVEGKAADPEQAKPNKLKNKVSPEETAGWKRVANIKALLDKGVSSASSVMRTIETYDRCSWAKALLEYSPR